MIDEKKLIEDVKKYFKDMFMGCIIDGDTMWLGKEVRNIIESQPKVGEWIPFTERKTDEEEKEVYGFDCILNCKLPDDGQEIIVSYASGCVDTDIFMKDGDECYLESGCEFINEAVAWQPLPESYKKVVHVDVYNDKR